MSVFALTEVRFIGATLQTHTFGVCLNQEVPHQLVCDVANWEIQEIYKHNLYFKLPP